MLRASLRLPDWFPITEGDAALAARKGVDLVTTTYLSADEIKEPEELKKAHAIQIHNLRLLHNVGVKLAIGPDVYGVVLFLITPASDSISNDFHVLSVSYHFTRP